jgi:uncharacterized protein YbbC (DUF1343 family)
LPGVDVFFSKHLEEKLKNKRIGLIINHTSISSTMKSTLDLFKEHKKNYRIELNRNKSQNCIFKKTFK